MYFLVRVRVRDGFKWLGLGLGVGLGLGLGLGVRVWVWIRIRVRVWIRIRVRVRVTMILNVGYLDNQKYNRRRVKTAAEYCHDKPFMPPKKIGNLQYKMGKRENKLVPHNNHIF